MVAAMSSRLALTLAVSFAALGACQSGGARPSGGGAAMRRDLDKICNAKQRSGADQDSSGQGTYMMAQWLNANVTSEEGRAFLVDFARLGQDKAARRKMLEDAAAKHGLSSCPLVDDWR